MGKLIADAGITANDALIAAGHGAACFSIFELRAARRIPCGRLRPARDAFADLLMRWAGEAQPQAAAGIGLVVDHSGPGLIATRRPMRPGTVSGVDPVGQFHHRKIPPQRFELRRGAELLVERFHQCVELGAQAARELRHMVTKCGAQYSDSTICSSAPEPASVFSASIRDSIAQGATM